MVLAGIDWGFINPACILPVEGINGKLKVLDEFYKSRVMIDSLIDIAFNFQGKYNIEAFYCDPSQPMFIKQFNDAGLTAYPGNNDVEKGIDVLKRLLERDELIITDNAPNLIEELKKYKYRYGNPIKTKDHAIDALKYVCLAFEELRQK